MNHWRNETLSKMFFFLIAGLIRLKDKSKLIKDVDVWRFILIAAEHTLKGSDLTRFSPLWFPVEEEALMRKPAGPAGRVRKGPGSILLLRFPGAPMVAAGKPPSRRAPTQLLMTS